MKMIRTQAPENLAVTLDEVKRHLRIRPAQTSRDLDLLRVAAGCCDELDGWAGHLGRALITQRWSLFLDAWPKGGIVELPLPPLQAVTCVKFVNPEGAWVHVPSSDYRVSGVGGVGKAELFPAVGKSWPVPYPGRDAIEIQFRCGFGDDAASIPGSLKSAILEMIGARTSVTDGLIRPEERMLPVGAMPGLQTLDHWRVWI